MTVDARLTTFGFEWGPARVSRMSELPGERIVIGVRTDHAELDIYVSKTGRSVRVFGKEGELTPKEENA